MITMSDNLWDGVAEYEPTLLDARKRDLVEDWGRTLTLIETLEASLHRARCELATMLDEPRVFVTADNAVIQALKEINRAMFTAQPEITDLLARRTIL